jgi:hypothetical protein
MAHILQSLSHSSYLHMNILKMRKQQGWKKEGEGGERRGWEGIPCSKEPNYSLWLSPENEVDGFSFKIFSRLAMNQEDLAENKTNGNRIK